MKSCQYAEKADPNGEAVEYNNSGWGHVINGFLFAITKDHYEKYKHSEEEYFEIPEEFRKWHGQENTFIKNHHKGCKAKILRFVWFKHIKEKGWTKITKKQTRD